MVRAVQSPANRLERHSAIIILNMHKNSAWVWRLLSALALWGRCRVFKSVVRVSWARRKRNVRTLCKFCMAYISIK